MIENRGSSVDNPAPPLAENEVLVFPLSSAQRRLWVLDRLEPNSTVYNVPIPLRLTGPLNIHALEQSFTEVVRRHEVLRATFELKDGAPVQVIHPAAPVGILVRDLTSFPPDRREPEAERLALEDAQTTFDLSRGPLLRVSLLRLADEDHVLLLTIHHIVFDGWSGRVLFRELMGAYNAFQSGAPLALRELPLQYSDYAVWQHSYLSGERLAKQLDYWKKQLQGAPSALELPTDYPRPARQSFRGARCSILLPTSLVKGLKLLSQKHDVTLFITLLSAFKLLLARYSGQDDIVVGSPVTGRNRTELENLIGFFVNTLLLRTDLSENPTFVQLLARVRETTLNAYAHQDVPFEKLVEELNPERDLSRNPIFQVMFVFQNTPSVNNSVPGLSMTSFRHADRASSKFDLSVSLVENSNNEIRATFEYCTDLFGTDTIVRMQQHFIHLLEGIAANPDHRISALPLLTADEKQELANFNGPTAEYKENLCLHNFFEIQVQKTPDSIAAICGRERISYDELNRRANQVAHYLRAHGAAPEIPVAICLKRTIDMLVAVLGVLKAGAAYVPLDPAYPDVRLKYILEDASPALVLTQQSLLPKLLAHEIPKVCLDRDWAKICCQSDDNPAATITTQNLAYILFTSGSTGRPKGVALEHRNAANFVQWARSVFSPEELAGTLFATSLCFDLSVFEMFVPWSVGSKVVVAESAIAFSESPAGSEITLINTVPSVMSELVRSARVPRSVQTINLAGEALPGSLVKQLYSLGHISKVYNLYGPTEGTTYSTFALMPRDGQVSIGRPIANTQVHLLDNYLQPVPLGVRGHIYLGGEGIARGYLNRPDLTRERFIVNPIAPEISPRLYYTGDLGRFLPDGTLQYLGRSDNQVKLRGHRIELAEIEKALERHPAVQQAAVVMRNSGSEAQLAAYVTSKPGVHLTGDKLKSHLAQILPAYMLPASFMVLDNLPLTATGKINRLALPQPETGRQESTAPRDALESTLLRVWEQVLGMTGLGIADNFFEKGGHSLLAVRLLSEIEKQTGKAVPLAALFQTATIELLAKFLREDRNQDHEMVVAVQADGKKPPFFGIVVPGANPLGFVALARHLGKDQPLYEIQGPGPRLHRPYTPKEFEQLAADYIRSMKTVQPHGPYYIGGMCEGARIAFDMARLLEAENESVGLLAILDTWVLENSQNRFLWKIDYFQKRVKSFWGSSPTNKWRAVRGWLQHRSGFSRPELLWPKAYWPGKDFVPAKYSGKITLFKIPNQPFFYVKDSLMGWGTRTSGTVEVQLIESRHLALLREPYVRALAPKISECLERARRESATGNQAVLPHIAATAPASVPGPGGASTSYFGYQNQQGLG